MEAINYGQVYGKVRNLLSIAIPICIVQIFQILWIIGVGKVVTYTGWKLLGCQVVLYLINLFWVLPDFFGTKKWFRWAIKQTVVLVIYFFTRAWIVYDHPWTKRYIEFLFSGEELVFFILHVFLVLVSAYSTALYRQSQMNFFKKEAALRANLESLKTMRRLETIMYQMQLSSHFTFNVLNTIKISTADKLPNVSLATEQLASILKGFLTGSLKKQMEELKNAVDAVSNYIELERFIKGKRFYINYKYDIPENNFEIPQGILLTLVENVFKYGTVHEEEFAALIEVKLLGNELTFHTWNLKKISSIKGHGLGQNNVKFILDHYYPNYSFLVNDSEDYYDLKLNIKL